MTIFYDSVVGCGHPRGRLFASLADGRHYTYGDVEAVSARFANVLAELGVTAGDRVAAQVPKSIEAVMLDLAALRVGAVFLPLNTGYTAAEVKVSSAMPSRGCWSATQRPRRCWRRSPSGQGPASKPWGFGAPPIAPPARSPTRALPPHRISPRCRGRPTISRPCSTPRDHRPLQGSDADPRELRPMPPPWRRCGASLARHAAPRPADLPHPWALRRHQRARCCPACRPVVPAAFRRRGGDRRPAAGERHDGRADLLHPPARRAAPRAALTAHMRLFISGSAPLAPESSPNGGRVPAMPSSSAMA